MQDELRWALLILGIVLLVGIYLYSRQQNGGGQKRASRQTRNEEWSEPVISGEDLWSDKLEGGDFSRKKEDRRFEETRIFREPPEYDYTETGTAELEEPEYYEEDEPFVDEVIEETVEPAPVQAWEPEPEEAPEDEPVASSSERTSSEPDKIVALRVAAAPGQTLSAEQMVLKLRQLGLKHGKYGIFHRHEDAQAEGQPVFSVANMTEPGSFNLTTLKHTRLPGVTLFAVFPNGQDPVESFESMVETARALAEDLDGEILDESGSTWSIQRERYIREDLIRYRLQLRK